MVGGALRGRKMERVVEGFGHWVCHSWVIMVAGFMVYGKGVVPWLRERRTPTFVKEPAYELDLRMSPPSQEYACE